MISYYALEGFPLKKLHHAVERFALTHPRFGIPGLMRFIIGGQVIAYLLYMFSNYAAISFLSFDLAHLLRGEVWRLVTWIFLPASFRPITFLISLMCYYSIGNTLEHSWGSAKFNLYYFSGMAVSVIAVILASLISGYWGWSLSGGYYLHMTLFLALAVLYPSMELNLWIFIFPLRLKARWLAWAYAVLIGIDLLRSALALNLAGVLLPVVSMLNFLVFFWEEMMDFLGFHTGRMRHQTSRQTIQFKSAAHQQRRKEANQGYRHKCAVCGRTDADSPDLEFRYCSRCAGYHCFCSDHIFSHEHFTHE